MPSELRPIATVVAALAVLVALTFWLAAKPAVVVGPIETAICVDENGRGHAQPFTVLIEPSWSPAVHATFATQRLGVATLAPGIRRPTRGVLRL